MVGWWIANAVLFLAIIPVVILLAQRVLTPAKEIRAYADDILEHGVGLTGTLDALPELVETQRLTGEAREQVGQYGAALGRLL